MAPAKSLRPLARPYAERASVMAEKISDADGGEKKHAVNDEVRMKNLLFLNTMKMISLSFFFWVMSLSVAYGQPNHLLEEVSTVRTETPTFSMGAEAEAPVTHCENPVIENYNSAADTILKTTKFLLDDAWVLISSPFRLDRKSAAWLGGILATGGMIYAYDREILDSVHRSKDSSPYKVLLKAGNFFEPAGLTKNTHSYFFAGYVVGYVLKWDRLQEASLQLLESMIFEGTSRWRIFSRAVGRARPSAGRGPRYFKFNGDLSFPSGHTSNIFQLATILSHHADHWAFTLLSYGIACTVGFQRLDVNSHWPSDVFFGAVYGTVISRAVIKMHERRKAKVVPTLSLNNGSVLVGAAYAF